MEILLENVCIENLQEIDTKIENTLAEVAKFFKNLTNEQANSADEAAKGDQDIIAFLKILIEFFSEQSGKGFEELLLPHLSEIRLQNCFGLLDSVEPEEGDDETTSNLWYKVVKIIEKYVEEKLLSTDTTPVIVESNGRRTIWFRYLQILKGIMSPAKLWDFHIKKRFEYLQRISCSCFIQEKEGLICLQCLFATCYELFIEDAEFIGLGCFMNLVLTWNDLYTFYNNVLSAAVTVSLNNLDQASEKSINALIPRYFKCFFNKHHCKQNFMAYKKDRVFPLNLQRNDNTNADSKNLEVIVIGLMEIVHNFECKLIKLMGPESANLKNSCSRILIQLPNDSPEQSPTHKNNTNEEYPWLWDWRLLFANRSFLTFLQRSLQNNISSCITTGCTKELLQHKKLQMLKTETIQCSQTKQKYRVLPSVSTVIKELNSFLPVLSASQGHLSPFSASFSHVIHTYLVELITHIKSLMEKNTSYPNSMDHLFTLHSSYYILKQALQQYAHISHGKNSQLSGLVSSINKSISVEMNNIELKIITWFRKVVLSGILHDSESHNWKDNKAFLEGENISYSLRMWNLFLKSMMHEMTAKLPTSAAVEICFDVLSDSLQLLVSRYSKAEASEVGMVQIRTEITFILLCTMEFMPTFSNSYDEFLGLQKNVQIVRSRCHYLHSYCSSLLITLAVKSSPISALYKTFRMGFPYLQEGLQTNKSVAAWVPWLHPALIPHAKDGSLISSVSVWLAVKFCISKSQVQPLPLIHALTMHTCTLAILLATEATHLPATMKEEQQKLLYALLLIVSHCRHQASYATDILMPVIDNSDGWESFDGHAAILSNRNSQVWWFQALSCFLKPTLQNILCTVISPILTRASVLASPFYVEWKTMYLHLRKVVRCSCSNASSVEKNMMLSVCALEILEGIANSVTIFPLPIQMCLFNIQEKLTNSRSKFRPVGGCVAVQVMTDIIFNILYNPSEMVKTFGFILSEPMIKLCSEIADYFLDLVTPKIKFEKCEIVPSCTEKAQGLLLKIHGFFKNCNPKTVSNRTMDEENYLPLICLALEQDENGKELLHYLYGVLCVNSKWIQRSLGITYALSLESMVNSLSPPSPLPNMIQGEMDEPKPEDSESLWVGEDNTASNISSHAVVQVQHEQNLSTPNFTLDIQDKDECVSFNPLAEVLKIGEDPYTFKQLLDFKFFWESLLSHLPLLGLSEEGFKTLLSHRWDINNEDLLSETDLKYVQALRSIFNLERKIGE